jgi:hypothetical protein
MKTRTALAQPALGVAGITLVLPVALLLGFGAGSAESSVLVLGPLATFGLPVLAMIAFWWEDWPGTTLRYQEWSGWADTVLVIVGAIVLTCVGQAIVDHVDLRGVFEADPGAAHAPTFPHAMPLAASAFVAMLELTLVTEGWPLHRLGKVRAGVVALAISWAVALAIYWLVDRTGLLVGPLLVSIGVWQVLLYVVLQGWPLRELRSQALRLVTANVVVLGGAYLTYAALHRLAEWHAPTIGAAGAAVVAGGLVVGMLFEGWPGIEDARSRALTLAAVAVVSGALYAVLSVYADGLRWTRAESADWVSHAGLNAIGAAVILHVGIGRRRPFS